MEMRNRYMKSGEIDPLRGARGNITESEGLKLSLEAVPVMLGRVERLDPDAEELGPAWVSDWFHLSMDVCDDQPRDLADHYRALILMADMHRRRPPSWMHAASGSPDHERRARQRLGIDPS
jgi:hypothetical protein